MTPPLNNNDEDLILYYELVDEIAAFEEETLPEIHLEDADE